MPKPQVPKLRHANTMPTHAKKMGKTRGKPLVLYIVQACVGIVDSIFVNGKLANIATHPSPIINLKHIPIPIHRFLRKSFNMNAFYRYGYVLLFPQKRHTVDDIN